MNTPVTKSRAGLSVLEYPPAKTNSFYRQLAVLPFETAIGLVSVWGGLASLFGLTTAGQSFSAALPPLMVSAFNLLYILSGLAIMLGIGWGYRNLEACGLILLLMSLLIRAIALLVAVGLTGAVLSAQISSVIFTAATVLRLLVLFRNGTIVQINGRARVE